MIIYSGTKQEFLGHVLGGDIKQRIITAYKGSAGGSVSPNEANSWQNSLMYMNNVVNTQAIPDEAGIAIEYKIPRSNRRIDFMISGLDEERNRTVIVIELKQWQSAEKTDKDGIVSTVLGRGIRETSHPSYQAWSYVMLLRDFNAGIEEFDIQLYPCAFLHNFPVEESDQISDGFYAEYLDKAPLFFRSDAQKLREFITTNVKYGDSKEAIYQIESGVIKPSKNLADYLSSLLKGNQEFVMIDDQKLVYETALQMAKQSSPDRKKVLIVEGGPGTGKSVVAINLLVEFTKERKLAQYVTKNSAPRAVYESKLKGSFKKSHISNMFKGSGSFHAAEANTYDALVVDEAHRLNAKSGMYSNLGENQIKEIINAAPFSVFFIDEDQKVTLKDIGEIDEIRRWAKHFGAEVVQLELASQFRCNGSDGYLSWLNGALEISETANEDLVDIEYDFKVFNTASELRDKIYAKNKLNNKARLVAGYCWDWVSKKQKNLDDIVLDGGKLSAKWNLTEDGSLWILKPNSVSEIGCIHTCQGLEVDYVGVIIGPDMVVRNGRVITDPSKRAKTDQSLRGLPGLRKIEPEYAELTADSIIKNTYRTLMTRGARGCYIYCTDEETQAYFSELSSTK